MIKTEVGVGTSGLDNARLDDDGETWERGVAWEGKLHARIAREGGLAGSKPRTAVGEDAQAGWAETGRGPAKPSSTCSTAGKADMRG